MSIASKFAFASLMVMTASAHADLLDSLKQVTQGIATVNSALGGGVANSGQHAGGGFGGAPALASPSGSQQVAQITISSDSRTREAADSALPLIKKALSLHQCMKTPDSLRILNADAVPGVDLTKVDPRWSIPNANNSTGGIGVKMQYHDLNKCVDVRAVDQWAMPALNALTFRVVYFAADSGETVNFKFSLRKIDDGSWKIANLCSGYGCGI